MKKTKVVIASVLKPIDDTRMLEKFGRSLAETNKYDINIIGIESKNIPASKHIDFKPLQSFPRLSVARLLAKWKVYKLCVKVKPETIIFNTHELLIVSILYKILFGGQIIYDVRENYAQNIKHTQVFPSLLRWPIATWVRCKEWLSKPFINHFILAEKAYADQLPFLGNRYTIIENKYAPPAKQRITYKRPDPDHINLLFTGTLSKENGLFDAIEWTKKLYKLDDRIRLRIVGYCALRHELEHLKVAIKDLNYIELNGGDHLVPHQEIIEAIEKADFGFVLKHNNQGTNDEKLLTRIFEYTAMQLPILLIDNPHWVSYCAQFNAAIIVSTSSHPAKLLEEMKGGIFYNQGDTNKSLWSSEESKLLALLN